MSVELRDDPWVLALRRGVGDLTLPEPLLRMGEGFGSVVIAAGDQLVVRIPKTIEVARQQRTADAVIPLVQPHLPVKLTSVRWRVAPSPDLPFGATAHTRISGTPLSPDSADPSLARHTGTLLATLHGIDTSVFQGLVPGPVAVAAGRDAVMSTSLAWLRLVEPSSTVRALERWWDVARRTMNAVDLQPALIHGDFWYGNLLASASGDRIEAILDWDQVCLDDPAQDLSTLLHAGPRFANAALVAYREASGSVDDPILARRDILWQYREFTGLAAAINQNDLPEMIDAHRKLRSGALQNIFEATS